MQIELRTDLEALKRLEERFNKTTSEIEKFMLAKAIQIRLDSMLSDMQDIKRRLEPSAIQETLDNA